MKKLYTLTFLFFSMHLLYGQLLGTGDYKGTPGLAKGFQTTQQCSNDAENWIRCSASLDKQSGFLTMNINLETNASHAGPKGHGTAFIYDCNGSLLARVSSAQIGRGGKTQTKAESSSFQASFHLGSKISSNACKIVVEVHCTGIESDWLNVSLKESKDKAGFIQQFNMFFF